MSGELAALVAALLWAIASVMFSQLGRQLRPLVLNLTKGLVALGLIGLTLALLARAPTGLGGGPVALLLISGLVGIGIGDTLFFAALNHLGPRRALLMETLAPPLTALLALVFLQERLSALAWGGIALTLGGVAWVIAEQTPTAGPMGKAGALSGRGVVLGFLAALGQAAGAVLSRAALADTAIDPLWSTALRLVGGLGVMGLLLGWQGNLGPKFRPLRQRQVLGLVVLAATVGTYLAIWLQQTALKYAAAGVAQALTATSPLFVLPLAALLGERVSVRSVLGALVALAGIWILVAQP